MALYQFLDLLAYWYSQGLNQIRTEAIGCFDYSFFGDALENLILLSS